MSSSRLSAAHVVPLVLGMLFAPVAAAAAVPVGKSIVQQRQDRAQPDRWGRSEDRPNDDGENASEESDADAAAGDGDADTDADGEEGAEALPPAHRGELNGKLRLGDW